MKAASRLPTFSIKQIFAFFFVITLLFKILLLTKIYFRFLFLLCTIIGLSWNGFVSLGLIGNKCLCSSMIFLMFGRVLLNFNTSRILGLFANFCLEVNKISPVTFDIRLNWSVRNFLCNLDWLKYFFNSSKMFAKLQSFWTDHF